MVSIGNLAIVGLQLFRTSFLDFLFYLVSFLFEFFIVFAVGVVLLFIYRNKESFLFLVSLLVTGLLTYVLKNLFKRPRPSHSIVNLGYGFIQELGLASFTSYSFPSGHAAVAFLVITFLLYFNPKFWYLPTFVAFLVPISRVYLGVHFPIDVLFGALFGLFMGSWFILHREKFYAYYDRIRNFFDDTKSV